jgi:hypothetical protein
MRSLRLLFLIILIKIACTWLALNVFVNLTSVSDPFTYVETDQHSEFLSNRTQFVGFLASSIASISNSMFPHYAFSLLSGLAIWVLVVQIPKRFIWMILPILFLPSVSVWSALVSKESLAVSALCLVLAAWTRVLQNKAPTSVTVACFTSGALFYSFLRPHFAVGAIALVGASLLLQPKPSNRSLATTFIPRVYRLDTTILISMVIIGCLCCYSLFFEGLNKIIRQSLVYFTYGIGGSSRNSWLSWNSEASFYENAWWAVPFSVIGPLPAEIMEKPLYAPAFLEGLLIFCVPLFCLLLLVPKIKKKPDAKLLYLYRVFFIVLPLVTTYLYLVHSPLGTMNSGSAIRYRTGFEYLITVPWLFIGATIYSLHNNSTAKDGTS